MDDGRRTSGGGRVLALLVAALLALAAFLGLRGGVPEFTADDRAAPITLASAPLDPGYVQAVVDPALVHINASTRPFGLGAAGSGIVLTAEGQVLTSHHVVKGADTVKVTDVGNGRSYAATVLGYDAAADIALLELAGAADLTTARIGASADLRVRDEVLAIGNAGGAGGTPTAVGGTVTDLNSTIVAVNAADMSRKPLRGMLEVAAAVSSGQSGGALADRGGAVVGVVAAASGDAGRATGRTPSGYAVPIDVAMRVVEQIRSGAPTDTVHIGPTATLGVLVSDAPWGARIDVAVSGLPAQVAGLTEGEVITELDGHAITTASALRAAINVRKPGETVRLGVAAAGSGLPRTVAVVLALGTPS
ncbi:PDZ domain-containing protein [Nocardia panacis]|uniref:PDZ domain-containing protein n=2 Tax=Nocardia panacis TaxID=2340916 RepID=A0A3A4KNM5_9NOCA|nr:PDZ domain-containing protein [Nocardia panacis]